VSSTRPEYVKCVLHNEHTHSFKAWCGRIVAVFDTPFMDANHAALSREQRQRYLVCQDCADAIASTLHSGWEGET
jgi:hypothetical protein